MPNYSPEKQNKTQFWPEIFHCFEQDRLLFARVDIGVTEFPTKRAKKEEKKMGSEIFFQKWACASRFQWGISIFLAAENSFGEEAGKTSKLAS